MQAKKANVKSKKEVVGVAEYLIFDSVSEAVGELSEGAVLDLINSQYRTNAMNAVRGAATGTPSKTYLRKLAGARITDAEFQSVLGDMDGIEALIQKKMREIEAEMAAEKAAAPTQSDEDEDDENEDEED